MFSFHRMKMFVLLRRCWLSTALLYVGIIFFAGFHFLTKFFSYSEGQFYNLMEETFENSRAFETLPAFSLYCTIEYANINRLQQDHPCVIELIRSQYLYKPASLDVSLNLSFPSVKDPSAGQSNVVLNHLKNKTDGFYVECGALDGEYGSNTLYMERYLKWNGILIEANKKLFDEILSKRRQAWALPVCLSTEPYPIKVEFDANDEAGKIYGLVGQTNRLKDIALNTGISSWLVEVQCFPLYSILLAVGRTNIDYFSLDVEGSEFKILVNIPWNLIDIKVLTVEIASRNKKDVHILRNFMSKKGFENTELMDGPGYYDLVFIKKQPMI